MAITEQTLKMLRILEQKNTKSMQKDLLARSLDVHERTIRREVANYRKIRGLMAEALGIHLPELQIVKKDGRAWVTLVSPRVELSAAAIFQYAAVYTAISHLTALDDEVLGATAKQTLDTLPLAEDKKWVRSLQRAFYFRPLAPKRYLGESLDVLDDLVFAVVFHHPVLFKYLGRSDQSPRRRRLEPYTVVMHRDGFYIFGRADDDTGLKLFALDRIKEVEVRRGQRFDLPIGYQPQDHFEGAFGVWFARDEEMTLKLAFEPAAARSARERSWPGFKSWSTLDDGRHQLHLFLPITPDVVSWILSWGEKVEVLSPAFLRKEIFVKAKALASKYKE